METKPIPASRIVDAVTSPQCLDLQCTDLRTVLDAVLEKVCSTDLPDLDFKCLSPVTTVGGLYQLLIDSVCTAQVPASVVEEPTYELCTLGVFSCESCLTVTNPCGDTTQADVIQALITRSNTLVQEVCALNKRVEALEATITSQQAEIDGLETCC